MNPEKVASLRLQKTVLLNARNFRSRLSIRSTSESVFAMFVCINVIKCQSLNCLVGFK